GVTKGKEWQAILFNLDDRQVGGGVSTYDGGLKYLVVVQGHFNLIGFSHHMVVCNDITILADDDAATRGDNSLAGLLAAGPEEKIPERIRHPEIIIVNAALTLIGGADVHDGVHGHLGHQGKVG